MIPHPWFRRLALSLAFLLVPLYLVVSQDRTGTTILNLVFDREENALIAVPGVEAQGPELTLTEIFNRVLRDGGGGAYYLAVLGEGGGGGASTLAELTDVDVTSTLPEDGQVLMWASGAAKWLPASNASASSYSDLLDVDVTTLPAGDGFVPIWNSSIEKWQAAAFPAGQTALTATSLRFTPSTQSGSCVLGANSLVILTAGGAVDCALPDPSDAATPGFYHILIQDDNPVTLSPAGTDLLNDTNAALPPIRGPLASFTVYRESATAWRATQMSSAGLGEVVTTPCALGPGNENDAASGSGAAFEHNLTCTIPANTLQAGATLQVCAQWFVTSATPENLFTSLRLGATTVHRNSSNPLSPVDSGVRGSTQCWELYVAEAPSAASDIYVSGVGNLGSFTSGTNTGASTTPFNINTTAAVVVSVASEWTAAGTGTNLWGLRALIVRGSKIRKL